MLAEQFHAAAVGARSLAQLEEISRLVWRAYAENHLDDTAAEAVSAALEARRAAIKGARPKPMATPPAPRRRPVSPDKARSIERRRRAAAGGIIPARLAAPFTPGENAALSIIGAEVRRTGQCDMPVDKIAALAGVSARTVQRALALAKRLGLIAVQERRRRGAPSLTNVITIVSPEWRAWLRLGGQGGGDRVTTASPHEVQDRFCRGKKPATVQKVGAHRGAAGRVLVLSQPETS